MNFEFATAGRIVFGRSVLKPVSYTHLDVYKRQVHDLVTVPPMHWHQFRATKDEPLGFLCLVNVERDRPELPGADDLAELRLLPDLAEFIKV